MIITVDGPAAAGKGTLSQKLADKYGINVNDSINILNEIFNKVLKEPALPLK